MASQMKVWSASAGTVTRQHKTSNAGTGCGQNKRLYVGRIGNYDYRSWLKFDLDWTDVGKVVSATLVVYTDDYLGENESSLSELGSNTPAIRVRRLTGQFTEGNNADEIWNSSDYRPGTTTTTGEKKVTMNEESNGINRIDITSIVNEWTPAGIKRSDGKTGSPAKNYGIGLIEYASEGDTNREWSGWSEDAADSATHPTIELVYEYGATTPDTPTGLSPSGAVASIGSFTGTFSDPRPSDKLAKSQVQVYSPAKTVTGISTGDVVTCSAAHGFKAGDIVYFTSLTGGTGLTTFTRYYVLASGLTATAFKVSTAAGGTAVDVTVAYTAAAVRTLIYDKTQPESNAAIVAAAFDHIPAYSIPLVRNTTYYWRARVQDQEGQWSAYTALTSFSVTNTDPTAPTITPTGKTYASLDGVQFRGTYSDPDGDRLLAYQVQLSTYAEGAPEWDDGTFLLWDTGKRFVAAGATAWQTPYGGESLNAAAYHWRARHWDFRQGVSSWTYGTITLSADFEADPELSTAAIQMRPRAPWRILIKEMKFNTVGGNITGNATTNVLTSASAHGLRAGRRVRFTSLTGGTGLLTGVDYYVKTTPTGTTFTLSATLNGSTLDFTTAVTAGALTAITTRGPGNIVAILEDAKNVGASLMWNSPGELHFTLGSAHPQLSVIEPRQTHYAVEFRQGDGWREVFAGLMMDFDATHNDIVFYGTDYLGLLDFTVDEHYDTARPDLSDDKGGSKYVNKTIGYIIKSQLQRAREPVNSIVGFIGTGSIAGYVNEGDPGSLSELLTLYSTYEPTLPFITSLLDSHRAGSGKRTRLWVQKSGTAYNFVVTDDPGTTRPDLRMRYGELVQGYRVIPFGQDWATRINGIGRNKDGIKVHYKSYQAPGLDEYVWGRWQTAQFIDGVTDANDMTRRIRQAILAKSKLGKQMALGLRSGVLQPLDGYQMCDQFLIDINDGSVDTTNFGSGYWVAVGITWQALEKGDLNTTLTLQPREDGTSPSSDLLVNQEISGGREWEIGWEAPTAVVPSTSATRYLNQTTGKTYVRTRGSILITGATGTI